MFLIRLGVDVRFMRAASRHPIATAIAAITATVSTTGQYSHGGGTLEADGHASAGLCGCTNADKPALSGPRGVPPAMPIAAAPPAQATPVKANNAPSASRPRSAASRPRDVVKAFTALDPRFWGDARFVSTRCK